MRTKLLLLALGFGLTSCASVDTIDTNTQSINVKSPKQEAMTILFNKGNTHNSSCTTKEDDVLCELIPLNKSQKGRQFVNFNFISNGNTTNIKITRYVTFNLTDGSTKQTKLPIDEKQLNGFSAYIEKHRNKFSN